MTKRSRAKKKVDPPAWALRGRAKSVLIYFGDPATKEALDAMAKANGITRSQMIALLIEQEAKRRAR